MSFPDEERGGHVCITSRRSVPWRGTSPLNAQSSDNVYATARICEQRPRFPTTCSARASASPFRRAVRSVGAFRSTGIREQQRPGTIADNAARDREGGVIGTADKSSAAIWPSTDTFVTYGGSADPVERFLGGVRHQRQHLRCGALGKRLVGYNKTGSVDSVRVYRHLRDVWQRRDRWLGAVRRRCSERHRRLLLRGQSARSRRTARRVPTMAARARRHLAW